MIYSELTVLIPSHGLEDFPTELGEKPAASLLNAFAVIWHPALLASGGAFPRWQRADSPSSGPTDRLFIVPTPCDDQMPQGWIALTKQAGSVVISGEHDRDEMLRQALAPLQLEELPDPELTADFLALGSMYLQVELLTRKMRNYSNLDETRMQRESVAAAQAAMNHDPEAARKYLATCFEMLLECRERFYPVECYLIDLCLVTPETVPANNEKFLAGPGAMNVLAPANDWDKILSANPLLADRVKAACEARRLEFLGGDDAEQTRCLMSLDASLWHLKQGGAILKRLTGTSPVVWARRRFGLGAHLPQLLERLGYKGALHTLLDDGYAPEQEQSQMRWEGSSGVCIDAFSRIPLAADGAASILRFPERMAESMDYDHLAAVVFAHWPTLRTPFFEDFRRANAYAPVLGKFVTFSEFFSHEGSPGRRAEFKAADYFSPTLIQSVARDEADPISRHVGYWHREQAFQRAEWPAHIASVIKRQPISSESTEALEATVRSGHPEATPEQARLADDAIANALSEASVQLRDLLAAQGTSGSGVLIVNTLSFPRKVLVEWPLAGGPPKDPAVLGVQVDADRVQVLVALPPCGFVWLANNTSRPDRTHPGKSPLAEELLLRNDRFEVRMSDATGGIAQILTYRRSPNRLSQQVALRFPHARTVSVGEGEERETYTTFYSAMRLRETRILSRGPVVGEIETLGELQDESSGEVLGTYRQLTRLILGRNAVEVELEIAPAQPIEGDPWTNYIGCRFAWKHEDVALTASMQQGAHVIKRERIEAPQFVEIADGDFRTTLLTPGLPFHRKTGERMLDTLLITKGESVRRFHFAIAIDAVYPMQAYLDQYSPPLVMTTQTQPADGRKEGWFFHVTAANVQLTRILPGATPDSIVVRLLETEGRSRVFGLHSFLTPVSARQVNFQGETISTLRIDDAVNVEISPYEICDVELTFKR